MKNLITILMVFATFNLFPNKETKCKELYNSRFDTIYYLTASQFLLANQTIKCVKKSFDKGFVKGSSPKILVYKDDFLKFINTLDSDNEVNENGTLLFQAVFNGLSSTVNLLLKIMSEELVSRKIDFIDYEDFIINAENHLGQNSLQYAVYSNSHEIVYSLINKVLKLFNKELIPVELFLDFIGPVKIPKLEGLDVTVLHYAIMSENLDSFEYIISVLHKELKKGKLTSSQYKSIINQKNAIGNTPLLSSLNNYKTLPFAKILIKNGADINIKNIYTPLNIAKSKQEQYLKGTEEYIKYQEIINLLNSKSATKNKI